MKTKLMTEITSDGLYVHDEEEHIYIHQEELARIIEEIKDDRCPVVGVPLILACLAGAAVYLGIYVLFFR